MSLDIRCETGGGKTVEMATGEAVARTRMQVEVISLVLQPLVKIRNVVEVEVTTTTMKRRSAK
jgi:hypothetical protein